MESTLTAEGSSKENPMDMTSSVRIALRALGANKLRSSLTMLGVIIGVGAVIALMSIGTGMQQQITSQVRGLGTNLLFMTRRAPSKPAA